MCDKELLISYVYDELQGAERKAFQQHLASCGACQQEVQALRGTRPQLLSWTVPERTLGLTVDSAPSAAAARRYRVAPAWALAAAAVLVLAVASAIANVAVTFVDGGVTIRAGRAAIVPASAEAPNAGASAPEALASVQERVSRLESMLASQQSGSRDLTPVSAPAAPTPSAPAIDEAALLRRVQQLIRDSEGRQEQQLARALVQVMREMQAAHTRDVLRVEQAINQTQGVWNDEIFRHREEMKQFYRFVNQQK